MTGKLSDAGPEVRQLLQTLLVMIEPLVQAAAVLGPVVDGEPGRCQQTWCPVCAVAATVSGEQHPLATLVAEHGAALLTLLRSVAGTADRTPPPGGPGAPTANAEQPAPSSGRYEAISVTIHE